MKKKLLAAFLCVAMVSSMIIGCGSNSSDTFIRQRGSHR